MGNRTITYRYGPSRAGNYQALERTRQEDRAIHEDHGDSRVYIEGSWGIYRGGSVSIIKTLKLLFLPDQIPQVKEFDEQEQELEDTIIRVAEAHEKTCTIASTRIRNAIKNKQGAENELE